MLLKRCSKLFMATTAKTPSSVSIPVLLCADFDETITLHDTLALLFKAARNPATQLVTQYTTEVGAFLQQCETVWQQRNSCCSLTTSYDGVGLRTFLEGYAAVDLRSLQRVIACRALQGICRQDVARAAKDVPVRAGYAETLGLVEDWRVLSANWSRKLVQAVLLHAGVEGAETRVIANELKTDALGMTTGEIQVQVQSPMDKAKWIGELRGAQVKGTCNPTVVYVGDSTNDLLALLEADVGVWLAADTGTSSAILLGKLVENYGIDVQPLNCCSSLGECVVKAESGGGRPVLFTMNNWGELKAVLKERPRN